MHNNEAAVTQICVFAPVPSPKKLWLVMCLRQVLHLKVMARLPSCTTCFRSFLYISPHHNFLVHFCGTFSLILVTDIV